MRHQLGKRGWEDIQEQRDLRIFIAVVMQRHFLGEQF